VGAGRDPVGLSAGEAAPQARDIPVFGGTGNFNSLMGRLISLFGRVGNFSGTASNPWAFRDDFCPNRPQCAKFAAFFPHMGRFRSRGDFHFGISRSPLGLDPKREPVFSPCSLDGRITSHPVEPELGP